MFGFGQGKQKRSSLNTVGMWMTGTDDGLITPAGYTPLSKNAEVKMCVHKIAELVSSMTITLMQNTKDGDLRIKNELSRKVDVNPNNLMTRKSFVYSVVADALLKGDGNCVVEPILSKDGRYIDNLEILNMDKVKFKESDNSYFIDYKGLKIDPMTVLHFVFVPSRESPYWGEGYAPMLKDTVANLVQANATKKGFMQSKWKPSLIIKVDGDVDALMDEASRDKIMQSYLGNSEAGKPWIVPAGEIDVAQVKPLTLNDLALHESVTLDKKTIAAAFGIPAFLLGVGEFKRDEYNNFINSVIMPIAKSIEQELTKKLLYSTEMYFKFNPRSLYQYDLKELAEVTKTLVQLGMMNRNEARNWFDLSPQPGLDDYIVLENFIPVSDVGNQKKLDNGGGENGE